MCMHNDDGECTTRLFYGWNDLYQRTDYIDRNGQFLVLSVCVIISALVELIILKVNHNDMVTIEEYNQCHHTSYTLRDIYGWIWWQRNKHKIHN